MLNSGVVLDVYDDIRGEVLRTIYPTQADLPGNVKVATVLDPGDRERLPDDVFALVVHQDGHKLRKFACIDAGNTVLSVDYFLKTAHKLPPEVRAQVAENLKKACSWYGLEKEAGVLGAASGVLGKAMTAMSVKSMADQVGARNAASKALGAGIHTPVEVAGAMGKKAEATGTCDMPVGSPSPSTKDKAKAVIQKSASTHGAAGTRLPGDLSVPTSAKMPDRLPQMRVMKPVVDGNGVSEARVPGEKKASIFALNGKFPLDSLVQVKTASAFFTEHGRRFLPEERREFCSNLLKRASAIGIEVPDVVRKYGSDTLAPLEEIKVAMASRMDLVGENERHILGELTKIAAAGMIDAEMLAITLEEFDKTVGIAHHYDQHVCDPYYSVYGFEKKASVPHAEALQRLASEGIELVKKAFVSEIAEEFQRDPVGIYESMPSDQKRILMRMAEECRSAHG